MPKLKKKLIGISGTHGTGKTYAAMYMAQAVKNTHPDARVGLLMEIAAECPFPINRESTEDSQLWIFTAQIAREIEMMRHYDIIVCDRTPADTIAYTWCLGFEALALGMCKIAGPHIERHYSEIVFRTMAKNNYCAIDGRRDPDPAWRRDVEFELAGIYRKIGVCKERIRFV